MSCEIRSLLVRKLSLIRWPRLLAKRIGICEARLFQCLDNFGQALRDISVSMLFGNQGNASTKRARAVLQRIHGDPDYRSIFTADRVWIERRDGEVVEERFEPRASFSGHDRCTPWDRLHLTYYLGYAIWNYLTVPFLHSFEE
jgi:hypothetical protein